MNKSTWQRAKAIFDEAREMVGDDRADFIDRECAGDTELRHQVEKLLANYDSDFLEETAFGAADILTQPGLADGQIIGRYCIRELIGTGGMGQVFRGDDTELDRSVAFKVLHTDVAEDKERVRRFIQEAKAASALNHPNILTIHEIGSFEGSRFIVSEYVDGETLRERMQTGLNAAESVDIACQIATALEAAHSAGIVHRDIKPENVMIRRDGLVKVLDFGLAKLTELDDQPIDPTAVIASRVHTTPGVIMGTVAYMSPEQARGQGVDARTDLWSLGVVLHEMLTGKSPFDGESATTLLTSILSNDSTPTDLDSLPPELTPICKKALTKEKTQRYQSAHDLLEDLKGEKKRMEYAIQPTAFVSVSSNDELKTQLIRPRPTLSAEYIVGSVKRHKYASLSALALVVLLAVGLSAYRFNGAPARPTGNYAIAPVIGPSTTEADLQMSRFLSSGKITEAAISPDGKYFTYITSDGSGKNGIRLRQLQTSADTEVVPAPSVGLFRDLSFSPDASQIYYLQRTDRNNKSLYRVSISGGPSTKIVDDAESGASFSPDGKTIAFMRDVDTDREGDDILVANVDGSNERLLVHSPAVGPWVGCGKIAAWSPDGKTLACWTVFDKDVYHYRLTNITVSDGSMQLRDEKWSGISGAVYMPDGSLVIAAEPLTSLSWGVPSQLWSITPNAPPKSITSGPTGNYTTLAATRSGNMLLTLHAGLVADLWSMSGGDISSAKEITNSGQVFPGSGFNWTPNGKILFTSTVSGNMDIWIMGDDGSNPRQLTTDSGMNMYPSMTKDGRYVVFLKRTFPPQTAKNEQHIFRMDADGKNLKQLTSGGVTSWTPRLSPDGKGVYYAEAGDGATHICKVSIDGGEPIRVAPVPKGHQAFIHDVSPKDGRIAYEYDLFAPRNNVARKFMIISATGGAPRTLELPASSNPNSTRAGLVRWTPDGRHLAFSDTRNDSTWDLIRGITDKGKVLPKPLFTFQGHVGIFEWSSDGKRLGYIRPRRFSDAILITNKGN